MKRFLFLVLFSLNLIAIIVSSIWLLHDKSFEAGLSLIVSIAGLIGLSQAKAKDRQPKTKPAQSIKNVRNSGMIQQAGRDIIK